MEKYDDREYWEAEMAYADGKYDVALEKIKHSFALKARFVVRSVRLAARIVRAKNECGAVEKVVELNEYMDKNYLYISLNIVVLR